MLTHGSLFSGIGGFDLGFERAGIKTVWQVEQNEYCRKVLARHFPDADRAVTDVREAGQHNLKSVDIISGGFPCQDVSSANSEGAGLDGERSGLWFEYLRIVRELRPRIVVVENVANLLKRGIGRVLGGLAGIGYDAEWSRIPASAFGAPHRRDRLWIVAYSTPPRERIFNPSRWVSETRCPFLWQSFGAIDTRIWLSTYCRVPRDVDGVSLPVDQSSGLGNAVVPQITEWIARRILDAGNAQ